MTVSTAPVLVTGGSGFIAAHCILALLDDGERVRTTARSLDREASIRELIRRAGGDDTHHEVVAADLTDDAGWAEAVAGCERVLHVASPIPHAEPKDDNGVIRPAVDGTLRVLRAAAEAGVKRVVLTSAFGTIGFGWGPTGHTFTEADWSKPEAPFFSTYNKSKLLAERAAWDFVAEHPGLELAVLNPVAVFGPVLGSSVSGGNEVVRRMLAGKLPITVSMWFPIVDVRDVARAHVAASRVPEAAGERFIVGSGEGLFMRDIARILRERLGDDARRVPTREIPAGLIRALARVLPAARGLAADLGITKNIDVSKAQRVLGLTTRPAADTIEATGRSMIERGIVDPPAAR